MENANRSLRGFQSISSYHESLNASMSKGNSFESTNGSKA